MAYRNQEEHNETRVTEFILLGFPGSPRAQMLIFIVFFTMYILTVLGNASIIILVTTSTRLHSPMYFFLCNLSFLEIWYTTASVPKILAIFMGRSRTISFAGCLLQMYFIFSFGCAEHILLAVMAYDRYLAICYPLHYHTIMDMRLSGKLAGGAWLGGFVVVIFPSYLITGLSFCGSNVINNFFCNIDNWIVLSCTNTSFLEKTVFITATFVIIGSCVVTLLSYMFIISTIIRIPSREGRKKAFSTCSSHFAVVIIWYGSTVFLFVKPSKQTALEVTKIVSIFNLIVVPVMNPFIYTLRNKDVRDVLKNKFHRT